MRLLSPKLLDSFSSVQARCSLGGGGSWFLSFTYIY